MLLTIRYVKTVVLNTETNEIVSAVESVETAESTMEFGTTAKATTRKKKAEKAAVEDSGKVTLSNNKLVLTPSIIEKINVEPGDRVAVNYISKGGQYLPVISKSTVFGDPEAGNKLTKSLTVSFKGKQAKSLELYGKEFDLVQDGDLAEGVYLLVDPNFKGLETIQESELIPIENKSSNVTPESLITECEANSLDESENNITFDFDFDNM